MRIWKLMPDSNNFNNFDVIFDNDRDFLIDDASFAGSPIEGWEPLSVTVDEEIRVGDMQSLDGGLPVMNQKAIDVLADLLEGRVQILPLDYKSGEYYILNILNVVDAINYEKSEVVRFSSGRIMRFEKYDFVAEKVLHEPIFKIPDERRRAPFVTDEFRDRVLAHNLVGFEFTEVWDSKK